MLAKADHCQDEMRTIESFKTLADKAAGDCEEMVIEVLYIVVSGSVTTLSKRIKSSEDGMD